MFSVAPIVNTSNPTTPNSKGNNISTYAVFAIGIITFIGLAMANQVKSLTGKVALGKHTKTFSTAR